MNIDINKNLNILNCHIRCTKISGVLYGHKKRAKDHEIPCPHSELAALCGLNYFLDNVANNSSR